MTDQPHSYDSMMALLKDVRLPLAILKKDNQTIELAALDAKTLTAYGEHLVGIIPAIYPEYLGSKEFLRAHHCRFPYIVGEMANGIASAEMVIAAAKAGLIGSFGAAGLTPDKIEQNLIEIKKQLPAEIKNWVENLIHIANEPLFEEKTVALFLKYEIRRVSASAYMDLSPHLVWYAASGLRENPDKSIHRNNYVMAKISRPELAEKFMRPAPTVILQQLVEQQKITPQQAKLAESIPVAEDITIEADSGGHTDNRPLTVLFPIISHLARRLQAEYNYTTPIRIGAAGSIGTPHAAAAAFAMGADYILTGSINQACVEAGTSNYARTQLAAANFVDVAMAAAADMFEIGVKLQVLKKGTMFPQRANKLYEIYSKYNALEDIPEQEKQTIEKSIFRESLDKVWQTTAEYFQARDPSQIIRAEKEPKYKMALVFSWYLGLSSVWAISGNEDRKLDFQVWCGPAMGSFNDWVQDSFLQAVPARHVAQVAKNILEGAATISRIQQLRHFGVSVDAYHFFYDPKQFNI